MISLHYANAVSDFVGPEGLAADVLAEALTHAAGLCEQVATDRSHGRYPFADLPYAEDVVRGVERFAVGCRGLFRNVVHIGIGGSALGAIALQTSLKSHLYNLMSARERDFCPRVFFLDNVDPEETRDLIALADPKDTLYHIVTKSGETTETIAAFLLALDRVRQATGDDYRRHFVVTTGAKGFLRGWADREKIATFDVPEGVGGRFSVLTPVGLLPAALMGIPPGELMSGAAMMDQACVRSDPKTNPACMLALIAWLLDTRRGKTIHVLMPYARSLRDVADWFRQLWAESLGKKSALDGTVVNAGPTPMLALGATDQHSQIQLFMEGPNNKFILFLAPKRFRRDEKVPKENAPGMEWLEGKSFSQLISAERAGTEASLTAAGRPNATLELEEISPRSIGALLMLLEMATVYAGRLYNVNPFDQPGVEHGKRAAFALLGRAGYEEERRKLESSAGDRDRYVVR